MTKYISFIRNVESFRSAGDERVSLDGAFNACACGLNVARGGHVEVHLEPRSRSHSWPAITNGGRLTGAERGGRASEPSAWGKGVIFRSVGGIEWSRVVSRKRYGPLGH